jgi:hypothetical protein
MSDLERSNVGILKIETAKERLVEFVEAINDIPSMYQRCKVSDNTLLGGRMALQNTGATTRLAILASKKIHGLSEDFRIMSQNMKDFSVQEIWAETMALHLGFPSYKTMDSWFLEHPVLWGSKHGLKIFSYNNLYNYNIFDTINFECITERWSLFLNSINDNKELKGSFFIE